MRKNNLGSRINYSARFVITPRINTDIDKIAIPYVGFAELYKYHLISLISTSKNIDLIKAEKIWRKGSLCFNEELYKYMQLLMDKTPDGLTAVLNRGIAA